jgi:hypothetical protein
MRDKRILLTILVAFLLALTLLIFFRSTVVNIFVVPLMYLFWLGDLILKSIDQRYIWWFLLGVMVIIVLRGLIQGQRRYDKSSKAVYRQRQTQRVSFWIAQLRRMASGTYPEEYSKYEIRKLILSVLSYSVNLSPREIEVRLKNGEFELPPEIRSEFELNNQIHDHEKNTFLFRLLQRFKMISSREPTSGGVKVSQEMEEAIRYLEKQLEINREH